MSYASIDAARSCSAADVLNKSKACMQELLI